MIGFRAVPLFGVALLGVAQTSAQEPSGVEGEALEARIWLDRGVEPVLRRGDQVRVYYRASLDAFVSIFHIDTNGFARLLHPGSPADDHSVLASRDYRVLFPESRYWHVDEDEGKGYLFIVASRAPLDFSQLPYSRYGGGWDISSVAQTGYRDPFLVMDDVVAAVVSQWWAAEYALDFVAYDIDRPHDYPRFLCYECHGFIPMYDWNPYEDWCTDFRVVIHDDPYYYPMYRYRGDRVVYTRPIAPLRPMFEFKERAGDEPATPLIRTRPGGPPWLPLLREGGPPPPVAEQGGWPPARVPRLSEPMQPMARSQPPESAPPEGAERTGERFPAIATDPPRPGGRRVAVERPVAVVRPEPGVRPDAVVRPEPTSARDEVGSPREGPLPDSAWERSGELPPPVTADSGQGRDERPVLRRRGGPPAAGSAPPRVRTPPPDRPPPSAGRPPEGSGDPAAGARPARARSGSPPPGVRSGPPPPSTRPPPAARPGTRPPERRPPPPPPRRPGRPG